MNDRVAIVHEIFTNGTPALFGVVIVICITWVVITIIKSMKQRANVRTRAELHRQMIDRFGTAPEFIEFLQSDTGQRFIEENINESGSPMTKILSSMQIGVVFSMLGIGVVVLGNIFGPIEITGDMYLIMMISGTVSAMIGIGFLISAVIAYRLCKTWGLLTVKTTSQSV